MTASFLKDNMPSISGVAKEIHRWIEELNIKS